MKPNKQTNKHWTDINPLWRAAIWSWYIVYTEKQWIVSSARSDCWLLKLGISSAIHWFASRLLE